jgi:uncharacterized protein
LPRALRKVPKLFLWDWSEIEEKGSRFENFPAGHRLEWCRFTQDWGLPPLDIHYLRDREKRGVDFLLTQN